MKRIIFVLLMLMGVAYGQVGRVTYDGVKVNKNLGIPVVDTTNSLNAPRYKWELRLDTTSGKLFTARALTGSYRWKAISGSGGGSDTSIITVRAVGTTGFSLIHPASDSAHLLLKRINTGVTMSYFETDSVPLLNTRIAGTQFTSGTSGTVTDVSNLIIVNIDPASTLSTFTLYLPASPVSNSEIEIIGGGTLTSGTIVTTLTINGNGNTLLGSASTLVFGTKIHICYTQGKYFIVQ